MPKGALGSSTTPPCLLESSQQPKRQVPLLAPFDQRENQGTETLSGFPKVTQPVWVQRGMAVGEGFSCICWTGKLILVTTKLEPRRSLGQGESGGRFRVNSGAREAGMAGGFWGHGEGVALMLLAETSVPATSSRGLGRGRTSLGRYPLIPSGGCYWGAGRGEDSLGKHPALVSAHSGHSRLRVLPNA